MCTVALYLFLVYSNAFWMVPGIAEITPAMKMFYCMCSLGAKNHIYLPYHVISFWFITNAVAAKSLQRGFRWLRFSFRCGDFFREGSFRYFN